MKKLRNFVKLDDNNEFVQGSNVKRPRKPSKDRWYEIYPPTCCEVSAVFGDPSDDYAIVTLSCGDAVLAQLSVETDDVETLAEVLNVAYPAFGTWSSTTTDLVLQSDICPDLSMEISFAAAPAEGTTTSTTTTSTSSTTTSSTTSTSTTTV